MRLLGKAPVNVKIVAESNKNDPLAPLWNPIIRGVQNSRYHAIMETGPIPLRVVAFEAAKMLSPVLGALRLEFRVFHLEPDIFKVILEGLASKALDVLKNERSWLRFAYSANRLREHVS